MNKASSLWLAAAGFAAPAAFFVVRNLGQARLSVLASTFIWALIALVLAASLAASLRLLGFRRLALRTVLGLSALWYLQFHFRDLREVLLPWAPAGLVHALTGGAMLLAATAFAALASPAVRRFAGYFMVVNLALVLFPRLTALMATAPLESAPLAPSTVPAGLESESGRRSNNVYYVVVDAMAGQGTLAQNFGLDLSGDVAALRQQGFLEVQRARASYNVTYLTLASIFEQRYMRDDTSPPYAHRKAFFPEMLYGPARVPLLEDLAALDYAVVHVGNEWAPCVQTRRISCLGSLLPDSKNPGSDWLFNYATDVFFDRSALKHLKRLAPRTWNSNDALGTANEFFRSHPEALAKKRQFFFIHHMNPHPPFTDPECRRFTESSYTRWEAEGYRSSVQCAMKRMREFSHEVLQHDPGAIIVFQGDHGPATHYDSQLSLSALTPEALDERFSIFNAIRLPQECQGGLAPTLGNVETINLVMACLAGQAPASPNPRSFAGFYEDNPEFGRVHPVALQR